MFTGIITNVGKVKKREEARFTFQTDEQLCAKLEQGTSIAVNGVCLTVEDHTTDTFSITVMPETLQKTMLGTLQTDALVNLELPVTPQTFLSGHIVQGHVDGVGKVKQIEDEGNSNILTIEIPEQLSKYIIEKGSITVNGISLTIIRVASNVFTVGIIPFTWEHTMLHTINVNDQVNIETDVLAKYMEKLVTPPVIPSEAEESHTTK